MTRKSPRKRFGTIAIEKGFITVDQLMDALEVQVREDLAGIKRRLIGRILYELGFLTLPQMELVLGSMDSYDISIHSQSDEAGDEQSELLS
jgi:hypothetical protein